MSLVDYKGRTLKVGNRVRIENDIPSENGMLYKHSIVKLDEWNDTLHRAKKHVSHSVWPENYGTPSNDGVPW